MEDDIKKVRGPQFPFISLAKAISRAEEFEAAFKEYPARATQAVKTWGYSDKSSGGTQTIAALMSYGLLADEGTLANRKLKLTPLARTILKDKRPGARNEAVRVAALSPKVMQTLSDEWKDGRPPDELAISTLHLDKRFTEEAAARFLKVYDETFAYASLAGEGTKEDNSGKNSEVKGEAVVANAPIPKPAGAPPVVAPAGPPPGASLATGKVPIMENERVVFAHELQPNHGFRLVVTGVVDDQMIKAIQAYAAFQSALVKGAKPAAEPSVDEQ